MTLVLGERNNGKGNLVEIKETNAKVIGFNGEE
jgi:hypothetical protein